MKKSTIGILGLGEVGNALKEVLAKKFSVLAKDLKLDEIGGKEIEVLHVCIPFSENFTNIVLSRIKKNKPRLVIIHTTVRPGTTAEIFEASKVLIVHSPVMGLHENLAKHILGFKKFIGPVNKKAALAAKNHLGNAGVKTKILDSPMETEVGKLLDTSYYAWNIIFSKIAWKMCNDLNIDFEKVYAEFNHVYNEGYKKFKPSVVRPILDYKKGPIGGHCLIPNAEILEDFRPSSITKVILNENEKF